MRVLVLGAYGVIGTRICIALLANEHEVVGLGRTTTRARRRLPGATWIARDLRRLATADDWRHLLAETRADVVVNAAGALQDGGRDDVEAVQETAIVALVGACSEANVKRFVQISATRASEGASTLFMQTKGRADEALRTSGLDWVTFRPGLVIASEAYGGTALVRALAAIPVRTLLAFPDSPIQTVDADEVAGAVVRAVEGRVPPRQTYDLVEDHAHSLSEITGAFRAWLGLSSQHTVAVPEGLARLVGRAADVLGHLGWRSPLRTTALEETRAGVTGDPESWRRLTGKPLASLHETLVRRPSTVQDRWFARLYLLLPAAIGTLSLFWIGSGLIALAHFSAAEGTLAGSSLPGGIRTAFVGGGALLDIMLGWLILWRSRTRPAAWGMIAASAAYLAGGAIFAPHLWADPLGPMLKVLPGMLLALVVAQLVDER